MASIIDLSPRAQTHLAQLLKTQSAEAGLRLAVKKSGCSGLKYETGMVDQPQTDDIVQQFDAVKVYVAPDSVEYLQGITLDYVDVGPGQMRLVFKNPNAQDACGCGESFSVAKANSEGQS